MTSSVLFTASSELSVLNQVGRNVKPSGTRYSLLQSNDEAIVQAYVTAYEKKRIGGSGYAHLVLGTSWTFLNNKSWIIENSALLNTGLLFITESTDTKSSSLTAAYAGKF
jgi:hypothetical protein